MSASETPLHVPVLVEEGTEAPSALARSEEQQFRDGKQIRDLAKEASEAEHDCNERFRDYFERLANVGITIAFAGAVVLGAIWLWHLTAPTSWRWLREQDLDHVQNLIAGGVLASLTADHFKRRLSRADQT